MHQFFLQNETSRSHCSYLKALGTKLRFWIPSSNIVVANPTAPVWLLEGPQLFIYIYIFNADSTTKVLLGSSVCRRFGALN